MISAIVCTGCEVPDCTRAPPAHTHSYTLAREHPRSLPCSLQ